MLQKCQALMLRAIRYGDSSLILKTFTREYGNRSFITGTSRKSKSGFRPALAQPLQQVELVFYDSPKSDLHRIKEARLVHHYQTLHYHPVKSCLGMFLGEVLQYLLQEEEPHEGLFQYLIESLNWLDRQEEAIGNFHLVLLLGLSAFLGFAPQKIQGHEEAPYFDMMEGHYSQDETSHPHQLEGAVLANWKKLQKQTLPTSQQMRLSNHERSQLLDAILTYYRLHIKDFGELKSRKILHQVLH